jgi:hypothetical protein
MTTTDTLQHDTEPARPASIRAFLDEGGDLAALDDTLLVWLSELAVYHRHCYGFEQLVKREKAAEREREQNGEHRAALWAEAIATHPMWAVQMELEELFQSWAGELVTDEGLCERIEAALPREVVARELEDVEAQRGRQFRLSVETREAYVCGVTGERHTGAAIVIRGRGYVADNMADVPELIFCPTALEAVVREAQDLNQRVSKGAQT